MIREERNELLADHAGRAEDAHGNRCHRSLSPVFLQKKSRRGKHRVGKVSSKLKVLLAVEHNSSNTANPLSTGPLSSVEESPHVFPGRAARAVQSGEYSMEPQCFK